MEMKNRMERGRLRRERSRLRQETKEATPYLNGQHQEIKTCFRRMQGGHTLEKAKTSSVALPG